MQMAANGSEGEEEGPLYMGILVPEKLSALPHALWEGHWWKLGLISTTGKRSLNITKFSFSSCMLFRLTNGLTLDFEQEGAIHFLWPVKSLTFL